MDRRQLHNDIDRILKGLDTPTGQQDYPPEETLPSEDTSETTIHVYLTGEQAVNKPAEETEQSESQSPVLIPRTWFIAHKRLSLGLASCVFILVAILIWYFFPSLTASATVTIIPASTEITTNTTVTVVPGIANITQHQVSERTLGALTLTQDRTVKATGTGHQEATAAHGFIILYNAALTSQIVPAGELLTSANGVEVATDQDAVLPAGNGATNGQTTVAAHALQAGPGGNIGAGEINGPCCRAYVIARNTAFTGGQNARSFQMVTQQDINGAVVAIKTSLNQSVQAALQVQVPPDETLITPVPCISKVSSNHKAGEEAQEITVAVDQTCTGMTYNTQALRSLLVQSVTEQATKQLDTHYTLAGNVQTRVIKSTSLADKTVELQVKGTGTWIYEFTDAQLHDIAAQIRGKREQDAKQLLLQIEGIQSVSITLEHTNTLPTDPERIQTLLVKSL